jgi:hypothetical protein
LVTFFRKCARESNIAREEENGSPARESRAENVFSSVLVLHFSLYLSHARAPSFGEERRRKDKFSGSKKKFSVFTVGAQPSVLATPETPTVIFVMSSISEYVVAPETNCIKAINAKKAVYNFVVNCIVTLCVVVTRAISFFFCVVKSFREESEKSEKRTKKAHEGATATNAASDQKKIKKISKPNDAH